MRVKVIDLYGVRYSDMEEKINRELETLESEGEILDIKVVGDALNKCALFVTYK